MTVARGLSAEAPSAVTGRNGTREQGSKATDAEGFTAAMRDVGSSQEGTGTANKPTSNEATPTKNKRSQAEAEAQSAQSTGQSTGASKDADLDAVVAAVDAVDAEDAGDELSKRAARADTGKSTDAAALERYGGPRRDRLDQETKNPRTAAKSARDAEGSTSEKTAGAAKGKARADKADVSSTKSQSAEATETTDGIEADAAAKTQAADPAAKSGANLDETASVGGDAEADATGKLPVADSAPLPAQGKSVDTGTGRKHRALHAPITAETDPELARLQAEKAGEAAKEALAPMLSAEQVAERLGIALPGQEDAVVEDDTAPPPPRDGRIIVTVGRGMSFAPAPAADEAAEAPSTTGGSTASLANPISPDAKLAAILGGFGLDSRFFADTEKDPATQSPMIDTAAGSKVSARLDQLSDSVSATALAGQSASSEAPAVAGDRDRRARSGNANEAAASGRAASAEATFAKAGKAEVALGEVAKTSRGNDLDNPAEIPGSAAQKTASAAAPDVTIARSALSADPRPSSGLPTRVDLVSMRTDFEPATRRAERRGADDVKTALPTSPAASARRVAASLGDNLAQALTGTSDLALDAGRADGAGQPDLMPSMARPGAAEIASRTAGELTAARPVSDGLGQSLAQSADAVRGSERSPMVEARGTIDTPVTATATTQPDPVDPQVADPLRGRNDDGRPNLQTSPSGSSARRDLPGQDSAATQGRGEAESPARSETVLTTRRSETAATSADSQPARLPQFQAGRDGGTVAGSAAAATAERHGDNRAFQSIATNAEMGASTRNAASSDQPAARSPRDGVSVDGRLAGREAARSNAPAMSEKPMAGMPSAERGDGARVNGQSRAETAPPDQARPASMARASADHAMPVSQTAAPGENARVDGTAAPAMKIPATGVATDRSRDAATAGVEMPVKTAQPSMQQSRNDARDLTNSLPGMVPSATSQVADAVASALGQVNGAANASGVERTRLRAGGAALKTMQIQLSPEQLGKLNITLKLIEGNLAVHIEASEPETALRLKDDTEGLKSLLKSAGFDVDDAVVTFGSRDASGARMAQQPAAQGEASTTGQSRGDQASSGQSSGGQGGRPGEGGARQSRPQPSPATPERIGENARRSPGIDPSVYL
ncbi:flagellar hook-length control protein FliK [Jiella mangrovi]|uniref:Flagellar hook-length control protein FliK n=1 Tax=Jiella mangrovi TaxID=2821407 RepID=A0ABS4BJB6_9HYPH|nr:flagellar hook-length control protein FliK [Jiella mangrovi]MBP0616642.1 flagellar hook-length control protein FliK [Jiella mangrovi]